MHAAGVGGGKAAAFRDGDSPPLPPGTAWVWGVRGGRRRGCGAVTPGRSPRRKTCVSHLPHTCFGLGMRQKAGQVATLLFFFFSL